MALFAECVPDTVHVYALVCKCIEFSFWTVLCWIIPLFWIKSRTPKVMLMRNWVTCLPWWPWICAWVTSELKKRSMCGFSCRRHVGEETGTAKTQRKITIVKGSEILDKTMGNNCLLFNAHIWAVLDLQGQSFGFKNIKSSNSHIQYFKCYYSI